MTEENGFDDVMRQTVPTSGSNDRKEQSLADGGQTSERNKPVSIKSTWTSHSFILGRSATRWRFSDM